MRLIDADALEKEMCSGCEYNKNKYANCDDCAIANAPTIDAVPVVRCKECKNRYTFDCPMCDDKTQDDDFCYMWQRERNEKCD